MVGYREGEARGNHRMLAPSRNFVDALRDSLHKTSKLCFGINIEVMYSSNGH